MPVSTDHFAPRFPTSELTPSVAASRFLETEMEGTALLSFRQSTCLGAIVLQDLNWADVPAGVRLSLESAAALLVPIFERRFTTDLLGSLQMPLDFTDSDSGFLEQVGELIGLSAGMEFSAIRELDEDGYLTCLGFWSHGEETASNYLDIKDPSALPPFSAAIQGKTRAVPDVSEVPEMQPFLDTAGLQNVRSFVAVPVEVGLNLFGVMSVAARCAFDYTSIELAGFESIANGLGVSLTNFRAFHEATSRIQRMTKTGLAITGLEVATSVRHEALNHLETAQGRLLVARKAVSGTTVKDIELASAKIASAGTALTKIRIAANPPAKTLSRVDINDVFEQARSQVQGRLQREKIKANYIGAPVSLDAYPDYLRSAFENLLLNSIDALQEGKRKGRTIELEVFSPSAKDTDVRAIFRDNGPGVAVQRLHIPDEEEMERSAESIFEPGVTSKKMGSGYGLWLVRRVMTYHRGSIDLRDIRHGAVFELTLRRDLEGTELGTDAR